MSIDSLSNAFAQLLYRRTRSPVISTSAPEVVRETISSRDIWNNAGQLGRATIQKQLALYNQGLADMEKRTGEASEMSSLFDVVVAKIAHTVGSDPEQDAMAIFANLPPTIQDRSFWSWERLPYTAVCAVRRSLGPEESISGKSRDKGVRTGVDTTMSDAFNSDLDEWVIRNEGTLRDDRSANWKRGMVRFSTDADTAFAIGSPSTLSSKARTLTRTNLSGFTFLDTKRARTIDIQPSLAEFANAFMELSDGLFKGLDWTNVFVAGGVVLGSLLSTDVEKDKEKYKHSDIDVYLYGLDPVQANEKIKHIYDVWKSNLQHNDAQVMVMRNSRTITFYSTYPTKRVQIVLKLVRNPKEVLLNFDLDICAMGWDGEELWLLPRAIRALQTGYSVFTMNLVSGHYLGDRRATQDARVFKYADRGYGIRILPSYVASLEKYDDQDTLNSISFGEYLEPGNLETKAEKAYRWIDLLIKTRLGEMPGPIVMNHDSITDRKQKTTDPQSRSCLSGFENFMRHVSLWKLACDGFVILDTPDFAYANYDDAAAPVSYEEAPMYVWNEQFDLAMLPVAIAGFNNNELAQLQLNLGSLDLIHRRWSPTDRPQFKDFVRDHEKIQRMAYGSSLEQVMGSKGDSWIPLYLPPDLTLYINDLVADALKDHSLPYDNPILVPALVDKNKLLINNTLQVVYWRIDAVLAWQQIDRRIDEAYEVLWSFHAANATLDAGYDDRIRILITHLSKRAIRKRPEDEFAAFARWVGRVPIPIGHSYNGNWYETGQPVKAMDSSGEEGTDDEWKW